MSSPYDTIEKIQKSDRKIMVHRAVYHIVIDLFDKDRYVEIRFVYDFCKYSFTSNFRLIKGDINNMVNLGVCFDENILTIAAEVSQKAFNLRNSPQGRLGFTKDRIFMFSSVFFLHKKSMFLEVFDVHIQLLKEAGLIDYWIRKYIDDRKTKTKHRKPTKLQIENVLAAFHVCLIMYNISFVTFALEVISVQYQRIQKMLEFFTY